MLLFLPQRRHKRVTSVENSELEGSRAKMGDMPMRSPDDEVRQLHRREPPAPRERSRRRSRRRFRDDRPQLRLPMPLSDQDREEAPEPASSSDTPERGIAHVDFYI
ncbi:MAG: hypothetical protein B7733_09360 [Myxococcales bacterium FL481]|nr:MAG: hypothetical protein B7733_09360 [Myxococcales bacterium FL481]